MRSENFETETKSLNDGLPACHVTGAEFVTNQMYKEDGTRHEDKFYDRNFHCQQIDDQT